MTIPEHMVLHGKGAFLLKTTRFGYGYNKGWKVTVEHDGIEIEIEDFTELDWMLELAGYGRLETTHNAVNTLPRVNVYLEAHTTKKGGYAYRIGSMIASDGTKVTRQQVLDAQKAKREARSTTAKHSAFVSQGLSISQQMGAVQAEKSVRFGHGYKLIRWQLTENPYYLIEVNGEYQLATRESRLVA